MSQTLWVSVGQAVPHFCTGSLSTWQHPANFSLLLVWGFHEAFRVAGWLAPLCGTLQCPVHVPWLTACTGEKGENGDAGEAPRSSCAVGYEDLTADPEIRLWSISGSSRGREGIEKTKGVSEDQAPRLREPRVRPGTREGVEARDSAPELAV